MPVQGPDSAVRWEARPPRVDGDLRLVLGKGVELAVAVYVLLKRAKPAGAVAAQPVINNETVVEPAAMCQDEGARRSKGDRAFCNGALDL